MLQYLNDARSHGVEVSSMWIQDWSGKTMTILGTRVFWNWKWNSEWYPNLDTVIKDLDAEGVKVTAYITAHLNIDGDVYKDNANQTYWLNDENGERIFQDFGQFTVGTVDLVDPSQDSKSINPAR